MGKSDVRIEKLDAYKRATGYDFVIDFEAFKKMWHIAFLQKSTIMQMVISKAPEMQIS